MIQRRWQGLFLHGLADLMIDDVKMETADQWMETADQWTNVPG